MVVEWLERAQAVGSAAVGVRGRGRPVLRLDACSLSIVVHPRSRQASSPLAASIHAVPAAVSGELFPVRAPTTRYPFVLYSLLRSLRLIFPSFLCRNHCCHCSQPVVPSLTSRSYLVAPAAPRAVCTFRLR